MGGSVSTAAGVALATRADDQIHEFSDQAQRDLNAALQLLAQRAEYITQAGGAAIALRREGRNEMICRARAGSTAPELGALFSTEVGLSGESVRTKKSLRCSDAERDARVNREICRELGIASVMVMPVVHDDQVVGVFELFSGKTNAFGDRDLATLERLSDMVATAVNLTQAVAVPVTLKVEIPFPSPTAKAAAARAGISPVPPTPIRTVREQKKLLWSAIDAPKMYDPDTFGGQQDDVGNVHQVPPALRNLRKCEACGFPVSAGRSLCVECEEKRWRARSPAKRPASDSVMEVASIPTPKRVSESSPSPKASTETSSSSVKQVAQAPVAGFTLSAGIEPSESWLSRHKYVIGTILAAAAAIAALALR
jgi:hypothetical protein